MSSGAARSAWSQRIKNVVSIMVARPHVAEAPVYNSAICCSENTPVELRKLRQEAIGSVGDARSWSEGESAVQKCQCCNDIAPHLPPVWLRTLASSKGVSTIVRAVDAATLPTITDMLIPFMKGSGAVSTRISLRSHNRRAPA